MESRLGFSNFLPDIPPSVRVKKRSREERSRKKNGFRPATWTRNSTVPAREKFHYIYKKTQSNL
jgi:hypothetical protein